jgi:hypothetical protein
MAAVMHRSQALVSESAQVPEQPQEMLTLGTHQPDPVMESASKDFRESASVVSLRGPLAFPALCSERVILAP